MRIRTSWVKSAVDMGRDSSVNDMVVLLGKMEGERDRKATEGSVGAFCVVVLSCVVSAVCFLWLVLASLLLLSLFFVLLSDRQAKESFFPAGLLRIFRGLRLMLDTRLLVVCVVVAAHPLPSSASPVGLGWRWQTTQDCP